MTSQATPATTDYHASVQALEGVRYPDRQSLPGSADRNVPVIAEALAPLLSAIQDGSSSHGASSQHRVLEIAAGHGHLNGALAKQWPGIEFEAAEADQVLVGRITEQCQCQANFKGAHQLEVGNSSMEDAVLRGQAYDMIVIANMLHIVPWETVGATFSFLQRALSKGGRVCVYGAFNEKGTFTSEGNAKFDGVLKGRNAAYGLRDIESEVVPLAAKHGLRLAEIKRLAAGNLLLVFETA